MKKLWSYISIFLSGVIGGLVLMYYMAGDQISIVVKKIKNKKTAGDNTVVIPIEVDAKKAKLKRKTKEQRRAERVDKRQAKNK